MFYEDILETITARTQQGPAPFLVAIDGRSCSGKSCLAAYLGEKLSAPVLHIDDFYLPFAQRTAQRMEQAGGHIDAERFCQEVLEPVSQGKEILYRPYRAHHDFWESEQKIPANSIYIVDGSYSFLPQLVDFYHYKIFLTTTPSVQLSRLLKREGREKTEQFLTRWIPAEEKYFAVCKVDSCADATFDTSALW